MVPFGDYLKASEEQIRLLEELQEIIETLKEFPSDEGIDNRIAEILARLKELRNFLKEIREGEGGEFELLRKYYELVGIEDERDLLEELLKLSLKGRTTVSRDLIVEELKEIKEFERHIREGPRSEES